MISPRPSLGPLASQRISLAIFIISAARALRAPCALTSSDLEVRAWNLFEAVLKLFPVSSETDLAASISKPAGALRPVPTAVPPRASSDRGVRVREMSSLSRSRELLQPLIS